MSTFYNPSQSPTQSFTAVSADVYLATQVEIGLSANEVVVGQAVTIDGFLSYFAEGGSQVALESKPVEIWVKAPGSTSFVKVATKTSGAGATMGEFSYNYIPTLVGTYEIYAVYGGLAPVGAYYGLASSQAGISMMV